MSKGVLLFCFNTETCEYHRIAERCVELIKKNLKLEITIVTNFETFKKMKPLGMINYRMIENEGELIAELLCITGELGGKMERLTTYDSKGRTGKKIIIEYDIKEKLV